MAHGHGGHRPGAGRPKASPNKVTLQKRALLLSVEEQFKAAAYDPIAEMIIIAQKARPTLMDSVKFDYHMKLARKYFPDVTAVKVAGRLDVVETMDASQRQARIDALLTKRQHPEGLPYADA